MYISKIIDFWLIDFLLVRESYETRGKVFHASPVLMGPNSEGSVVSY